MDTEEKRVIDLDPHPEAEVIMSPMQEYAKKLPKIYQDVLMQFPVIDPYRTPGSGLAIPTVYAGLKEHYREVQQQLPYSNGLVHQAFKNMAASGVFELRDDFFAYPRPLGEELIAILSGYQPPTLDPFPSPPGHPAGEAQK